MFGRGQGHYCCPGLQNPGLLEEEQLTLELVDSKGSGLGGSKHLDAILNNFCPHPVRWKQVWYKVRDRTIRTTLQNDGPDHLGLR